MSKLSNLIRKNKKTIRHIGKVVDIGSDLLPPGFKQAGDFAGKRLQGQNTKQALKGTAGDFVMGKAMGKVGGGMPSGGRLQVPGAPPMNSFTGSAQPGMMTRAMQQIRANAPQVLSRMASGDEEQGGAPKRTGVNRWLGPIGDLFKRPGALEAGANLAGGYLEGRAAGKIAEEDRKWDREKFGRTQALDEGATAVGLGRDLSMAPMRDQAMFMLQQRMGLSPGAMRPRDMFNESTSADVPQLGGIDLEELKRRNAGYTPGKGGYNTDIQRLLLQKLGYGGAGNA